MSLLPHFQSVKMAKLTGTLSLQEDSDRETHCLLIYSCYVQKGFQLCWKNQNMKGGSRGWRFVEVHHVYLIYFLQTNHYFFARQLRKKCNAS